MCPNLYFLKFGKNLSNSHCLTPLFLSSHWMTPLFWRKISHRKRSCHPSTPVTSKVDCPLISHSKQILSQWAWFSMSTRNFIGSGQNSAHPLLDDRWIARSAITRGSCVLNAREHAYSVMRLVANGIYARDERSTMIVVDTGYAGIHHSKYWMPIHYDTSKTKNLIFYSLTDSYINLNRRIEIGGGGQLSPWLRHWGGSCPSSCYMLWFNRNAEVQQNFACKKNIATQTGVWGVAPGKFWKSNKCNFFDPPFLGLESFLTPSPFWEFESFWPPFWRFKTF